MKPRWDGEPHGLRRCVVLILVTLAVALTASCASSAPSEGDYPAYPSDTALVEKASAVVLGDVLSERSENIEGIDYRVISVTVLADAKATYSAGDEFEVKLTTGNVAEPDPSLEVNGRYILFVETYDSVPASLLNPWQASYEVRDGHIISDPANEVILGSELLQALGLS